MYTCSDKLGLHLLKKLHDYGSIKIPYETTSEESNNNNKTNHKKSSSPHGPKFLADCQNPTPRTNLDVAVYLVYFTVYVNSLVLSGVGFGAYCAVDFALVMDVLPNDREKAKDLAVWHQVSE